MVLLTLGLGGVESVSGEPVLGVEHNDCIIEPMMVVEVGTSVAGVIDEMLVDRSDRVDSGQPLARLESSVEEVTVRRSRERSGMHSEVRARQADLELARQKMRRITDLFARKMVSKQQYDEAVNELERADQAVRIAREKLRLAKLDLEQAQAQLDRRVIRSPISGVVLERLAQVGEYVDERPLLRVAQLDPLRVEILMPAQAFGSIRPGMAARVTPELTTGAALEAEVVLVDPVIDTASGTFGVRLELPNADYATPSGLRCRVSFAAPSLEPDSIAAGDDGPMDEAGFLAPADGSADRTPDPTPPATPSTRAESETPDLGIPASEGSRRLVDAPLATAAVAVDATAGAPGQIADPESTASPPSPPGPDPAVREPSARCWQLGPWPEAGAPEALAERLRRRGAQPLLRQDDIEQDRQWMVFVPGRGGVDTADRLTGLAKAGVEDLYVVRRGQQRGDVSVGLYNHRRNARRRIEALRALGFEARLAAHPRTSRQHWLLVGGVTEEQLGALEDLGEANPTPTACEGVGSAAADNVLVDTRPAGQVLGRLE